MAEAQSKRRRFRRGGLALLVFLALLALPLHGAVADDAPPDAAQLKRQAERWWASRKRVAARCFQCNGQGKVRWGRRIVTCPKCRGRGVYVDPDDWKKCWWEMRSPAFRDVDGAKDRVESEFKSWHPEIVSTFIIAGDPEVGPPGYGIVRVKINHAKEPIEQRWIAEAGDWWLYDAKADGKWPEVQDVEKLEPLDPADLEKVRKTIVTTGTRFSVVSAGTNDKAWVVVRMEPPKGMAHPWEQVMKDAVDVARSLLDRYSYAGARLEWWHKWRDELGHVEQRLAITTSLSREKNEAAVWANLNPAEQAKVLTWKQEHYQGWIPWPR